MSKDIVFSFKYAPTLKAFNANRKRIRSVQGPFGSGKSSACVIDLWEQACMQAPNSDGVRRTRFGIIRNFYRQLFDTTRVTVLEWLPEAYFGNFVKNDNVYYLNVKLADGTTVASEWLFRALDKPEHVKNLLSMELTSAWINEYREIPKAIFDALDGRIGRFPPRKEEGPTYSCIIMDTNPPDYDHWAYHMFEEDINSDPALDAKVVLFKQPSGLSPQAENLPFLPKDYYKNLAIGKDKDWIRVYVEGQYGYVKSGKPVYQNFSDHLHVSEKDLEPVRGIPIIIGMDFASCPSAVICQGLPSGRFQVLREVQGHHGMTVRSFLADMLRPIVAAYYSGYRTLVVGDPSGRNQASSDGSTCFKELRNAGFKAIPAKSNAIQARLAAVDSLLTSMIKQQDDENLVPKLLLSATTTPLLRKGFMGEYKYRESSTQFGTIVAPTPLKNEFADVHDALQYAALGYEKIHMAENAEHERRSSESSSSTKHTHDQVKGALY